MFYGGFDKDGLIMVCSYLQAKTAGLRADNCKDEYGFAFGAFRVVFRYSRMKFGHVRPAYDAIAAWMDCSDDGWADDLDLSCIGEWEPGSCGGTVLRALHDAADNNFDCALLGVQND